MTDQTTQASVDQTQAPAEPAAAVDSARTEPDLEQLLASYDAETSKPSVTPSPPETKTEPQTPVPDPRVDQIYRRIVSEDIDKAAEVVREGTGLSKAAARKYLQGVASENPTLIRIFDNRDRDPATFQRALVSINRELQKELGRRPDPEATADRAAVVHAVRGASTTTPPAEPPPNLGAMTDAELREYTRKNFGFV